MYKKFLFALGSSFLLASCAPYYAENYATPQQVPSRPTSSNGVNYTGQLAAYQNVNNQRIELWNAECNIPSLKKDYPYKVTVTKFADKSVTQLCFKADPRNRVATIAGVGVAPTKVSYSEFTEMQSSSGNVQSSSGGTAAATRLINGFNQGLADAQKFTQPPQSNVRNCRSVVNGNVVNTTCN